MAIKIPSKHIYEKQNPKIRDNVIERLEVGQYEVLPTNEYAVDLYTQSCKDFFKDTGANDKSDTRKGFVDAPDVLNFVVAVSHCGYFNIKYTDNPIIKIPIVSDNKRVKSLLLGVDKEGATNIKYSINGIYKYGTAICDYTGKINKVSADNYSLDITLGTINLGNVVSQNEQSYEIPKTLSKTPDGYNWGGQNIVTVPNVTSTVDIPQRIDNLDTVMPYKETIDGVEYVCLALTSILAGATTVELAGTTVTKADVGDVFPFAVSGKITGVYKIYEPKSVDVTIYGNRIGIELKEKTVYVPELDKSGKYTYSISSNEFLQTDNTFYVTTDEKLIEGIDYQISQNVGTHISKKITFLGNAVNIGKTIKYTIDGKEYSLDLGIGENATTIFYNASDISVYKKADLSHNKVIFDKIREKYKNGKETATIRCSISDYYDYSTNNKVIAIDNSTRKMSFDLYDQVIPMVYGADGNDKPMSLNQDGTPKIFNVLGVKTFYDGAVWQELSLQEV